MYRSFLGITLLLFFASCSSPKRAIYFNSDKKGDTTTKVSSLTPRPDLIINEDDILAINISSVDAFTQKDPVAIFNEGGVPYAISAQGSTGGQSVKGYLVGPDGNIDFPVVGRIKLAGLTPTQAKDMLSSKLKDYIKSPVVEVRIINYKINMLGEVARVGPVLAPNHKMNILEAIAAAGDIPLTGRKDNVLIIREKNGKQEFGHINLNSKDVFTSPYYYLQQNDIVYVEPNRIKRQETNEFLRFYLPTFATILTSILSVYGIVQLTKTK